MTQNGSARRGRLSRMAGVPLILFAVFNGITVGWGLFDSLSDQMFVARLVISVMGGVTIATLVAFAWRMLMRGAAAGERDPYTASLGGIVALVGILVSAWFLASLIGGDDAQRAYQSDHLEALQAQANRISQNGALDAKVVTTTRTAAIEVGEMAKAEAANGLISRIAQGRGEWARSLEAFATTLESRALEMEAQQARREERLLLFEKTLVEARIAASKSDQGRFEDLVTRAGRLLTEADRVANHATVSALGTGLMAQEAKEQIGQTMIKLKEVADDAATQWQGAAVPFYRPVSKQVATALNAAAVPGAWTVAVAFEVLPLILLMIVLLRPDDPESRRSDNDNVAAEAAVPNPSLRDAA